MPLKQAGFTLLELLVAFVIMAFSLGMLYQASGGAVRSVGDTEQYARATVLAQSLLNAKSAVPETGWNESGESAGLAWTVRSAPYGNASSNPSVPRLHEIQIVISWTNWRGSREMQLSTLLPQAKPKVVPR
jgi:general secretion pathway protein I